MRITFVTMATAMVCLMGVHGDVQPQRDFDLQRFAGKWYRVGLAYDSPGFTALYRDKLRVSMGILNPQTNGNVNLTMWTQRSSGCRSKLYTYEKTAIPGAFTYFSTRHNKVKDITVVETNYNEYALVLKHKKMDREYTQVALYGRSQKVKPEVIQKFRDFATSHGFPKDAILTPPPAGSSLKNCPPSGR
ncbi:neutrophil gelatinase-associated lipocalin isoform X1 [Salmo salar]|uniref:Neutrophil gelatinase-associated lipocalin isoform X1 n=1 Tax=Salmo salar TaxID=8030 RepID=A0A1S3KR13_SALSA|nr:prostaglandin D2 synthase a isoform X1 [Salmo salar]XP_029564427.1 neutrophil gelatinase-associated lipocalin isoform X1 [Salmo trutta]|eukprot:XP_013981062.1 PREDICTED: neutrophil gelatinase-associated lipocalin isoform X1 [Salmo salar]